MSKYILHMHNHAGWFTQIINAENLTDALIKGLDKKAEFLSFKANILSLIVRF